MTLTELCGHLRNWFAVDTRYGVYEISGGVLDLPFLRDGQYFRIMGSVFNDGVWQYRGNGQAAGYDSGLTDEIFDGAVQAMAVPADVCSLLSDITSWEEKYRDAADSPYQSESFGGYTYTKASGGDASGGGMTWQSVFRSRLNRWRKL